MKKGLDRTERCLEKSDKTAAALEDASQAVITISDLNAQIDSTAEEHSASAGQISDNVNNISNITERPLKAPLKPLLPIKILLRTNQPTH